MGSIFDLIEVGGSPLGGAADFSTKPLASLLRSKNGFFAFESALLVRPCGGGSGSIEWWNEQIEWRLIYPDLPADAVFFAEDIFGFQFLSSSSGFYSFDPETGEMEIVGLTVEEWASAIMKDFDQLTGYSIARKWQMANGRIPNGSRLSADTPFVLGGSFEAADLKSRNELELIKFRAAVFSQIKNLPDGARVQFEITDIDFGRSYE